MYLEPFHRFFPAQAAAETRVAFIRDHDVLPGDEYALSESYCTDPACNCRRVLLTVFGRRQAARGILASIGFGFDRDGDFPGPDLDPLNPQSEYAEALLDLVAWVLTDPAYVARFEDHYRQMKQAGAAPAAKTRPAAPWRAARSSRNNRPRSKR